MPGFVPDASEFLPAAARIIVFAAGLILQAGTISAVKAIKMSAKLGSGHQQPAAG
jgi:hypothetical protein